MAGGAFGRELFFAILLLLGAVQGSAWSASATTAGTDDIVTSRSWAFDAGIDPLDAGQQALRAGHPEEAIPLLRQASVTHGDSIEGASARYLLAQAFDDLGTSPEEALSAYLAFLAQDEQRAPARMVSVAEARVAWLRAERHDWSAWSDLEALRRQIPGRPYRERLASLEHFITGAPPPVAAAARSMLVQDAWESGDWQSALHSLELQGADRQDAAPMLKLQIRQVRKEIRRDRLAYLAVGVIVSCCLGGGLLRPWRELRKRDLRWLVVLAANWTLLSMLLYGIYAVGRRAGDVSPVTIERFVVLWGSVTSALLVGAVWNVAFRRRLDAVGRSLAAVAAGLLLCGSALYLYCYTYDYVSVFRL